MAGLNKEKILLLASLVVCGGLFALRDGGFDAKPPRTGKTKGAKSLDIPAALIPVESYSRELRRHDVFLPPAECEPLAALALDPPPRDPMPIVAPVPLPGPGPRGYAVLLVSGEMARTPVALAAGTDEGPQAGPEAPTGDAPVGEEVGGSEGLTEDQDAQDELKKRYDWIELDTGSVVYGYIKDPPGSSRFDLKAGLEGIKEVTFNQFNVKRGTQSASYPLSRERIIKFGFAKTIPNWIELTRRTIPRGATYLNERKAFILDLLERAEEYPEALTTALKQAEILLEDAPNNPLAWRLQGQVFFRTGELDAVYKLYQDLQQKELFKDQAFSYLGLGLLYHQLTLDKAALAEFKHAVRLEPSSWEALTTLGDFYLEDRQFSAALPLLKKANNFIPAELAKARFNNRYRLASAYLGMGMVEEAANAAARARAGGFETPQLDLLDGLIQICSKQSTAALTPLMNAVNGMADAAEAMLALGVAQAISGKFNEALGTLTAAGGRDPLVKPRALAAIAWVYRRAGHPSDALQNAEDGLRMSPDDPYLLYLTGRLRRESGDLEGARTVLTALLRNYHDVPVVLMEMAALEGEDEALAQAELFASRAVEKAGEDVSQVWVDFLGDILLRQHKTHEAEEIFAAGVQRNRSPHAQIGMAQVYYYRSDPVNALDRLKLLMENPEFDQHWIRFATEQYEQIRTHILKEQVLDGFDRETLSRSWSLLKHGNTRPEIKAGRLVLQGKISPKKKHEPLGVVRLGESPQHFVSVEVECTIMAGHQAERAGLRIGVKKQSGATMSPEIRVYWDNTAKVRPRFQVIGATSSSRKKEDHLPQSVEPTSLWELGKPVHLRLEYGEEGGNEESSKLQKVLRIYVGGTMVKKVPLLRFSTKQGLQVQLFAMGKPGEKVHVLFDNFRFVRRAREK